MGPKPIFVDTHGFYAWADSKSPCHDKARELVYRRDRRFVTTAWIVVETINLFVARKQAHWVEPVLDFLQTTQAVRTLEPTWQQFQDAQTLWRKYRDHAFPLTDCTSFVAMRELGLKDALTADRHFLTMGFNPLLAD
jgi:hypothetical protein